MAQARRASPRSVSLYPDEWDLLEEEAHRQRKRSVSELLREMVREKFGAASEDGEDAGEPEAVGAGR